MVTVCCPERTNAVIPKTGKVNVMGMASRSQGGHRLSPNDERSNSKDPTSHESRDAPDNRSTQLNPASPEFEGPSASKNSVPQCSED